MLQVHYHRTDGNYKDVGLWTWDWDGRRSPEQAEVFATGRTPFGVRFDIDTSLYGTDPAKLALGMIPRIEKDWNKKDGTDRKWSRSMGMEIWLVQGEETVFTSEPDLSPRVKRAWLDGPRYLRVLFTAPVVADSVLADPSGLKLSSPGMPDIAVKQFSVVGKSVATIETAQEVPFEGRAWTLHVPGYRPGPIFPRNVMFDAERFYTDEAMGAIYTATSTTFRVFSPTAESIQVVLYPQIRGDEGRTEHALSYKGRGVWEGTVEGDLEGQFYMLRVKQPWVDEPREVADIWATNTTGRGARPRITDLRKTDPEGFRPAQRPPFSGRYTDAVITQFHIRDFSIAEDSGMTNKGKYLAFTEEDTHLPGNPEIKTGMAHLKQMGVTHLQLMPFHDMDNFEERDDYNWGYMTTAFNSPDGWFATNIEGPERIKETKMMIQALHRAGIRVILDVVYNHTAPNSTFEAIVPHYYHRIRDDGSFWNGSGTGNEFRSEAPMGRRFIVDSVKFWVEEYQIDGYRWDLLGLIDIETSNLMRQELHAIDPTLIIYGEPWTAGPNATPGVSDKTSLPGSGVAMFNDDFRNALKGTPDGPNPGFVHNASQRDWVVKGIRGSIDDWAKNPVDSINYGDVHDNLVLWDKTAEAMKDAPIEERLKAHNLTLATLMISQGIPLFHGGHEMVRTKDGNHNSYNAPDSVNQVDWSRKAEFLPIFDYTRNMVAIRRAHPIFRLGTAAEVKERVTVLPQEATRPNVIQVRLNGEGLEGETWKTALVFINPDTTPQRFALPDGAWTIYAQGGTASPEGLGSAQGVIEVGGRTLTLLAR